MMKIAVTYENGNVFQHFGRTEQFKVYEVEDEKVVSSRVIESGGAGCGALAGFLAANGVDVVICGGIGGGAMNHLVEAGLEVCSGAQGDADAAVDAYLKGELTSEGANCDHHEHGEGHHCGHHGEEEDHECCGHGDEEDHECCGRHGEDEGEDGHCCGRHRRQLTVDGKNAGRTVRVHYRGTFDDGSQFDSSYDRGEPLEFVCGAGMMIKGFDAAVADLKVGQIVDVHLMPEEAYGPSNPDAILTVPISDIPGAEGLTLGQQVYLQGAMGQPIPCRVTALENGNITFDANHEMAGKELNFRIELVEVLD